MQNGNLKCNADDCVYNSSCECRAGGIKVGVHKATSTSKTVCASYVNRANSGFTNTVDNGYTQTQDIKCEAANCKYNENLLCKAESVKINAQDASCDTFILE